MYCIRFSISVEGTLSLHQHNSSQHSHLIGFVHHTQIVTLQLDGGVGHAPITKSSQRTRPLAQDFITRPSLLFSLCAEWSAHDTRGCSSRRTESCWELLWSYAVVCDTSSMKNTYFTFISSTVRFYMFISLWGSVRKTACYWRNCLKKAGMSMFKIIICES